MVSQLLEELTLKAWSRRDPFEILKETVLLVVRVQCMRYSRTNHTVN